MSALASLKVSPLAQLFRALGDETRMRIVALLSHGELCVCHIETALELPQPKASRHLGVLKNAGVVEARRNGSWVYYRLAPQRDEPCRRQLEAVITGYASSQTMKRDLARLVRTKGPAACR
jgi:ArsR family transcriptional regulator